MNDATTHDDHIRHQRRFLKACRALRRAEQEALDTCDRSGLDSLIQVLFSDPAGRAAIRTQPLKGTE